MTQVSHWSATKFMRWEQCPGLFKSRYIDEEPEPETEALVFGKAVHMGLEAHFRGDDGVRVFRAAWKQMSGQLPSVDKRLTSRGLDLMELVFELGLEGAPERGFSIDTNADLGAPIVGAIDLWGYDGTTYDFKTTQGLWSQARAQSELWQPVLYTWARWLEEPAYSGNFEYVVLNRNTGTLQRFRREWTTDEINVQMNEAWSRMRYVASAVAADIFTCRDNHGFCPECGARWGHGHVCDQVTERIRLR